MTFMSKTVNLRHERSGGARRKSVKQKEEILKKKKAMKKFTTVAYQVGFPKMSSKAFVK